MFSKEAALLEQIAESRQSIRQKHLQLKSNLHDVQTDVSKVFQPIIKPLNKIASDDKQKRVHPYLHSSTPRKNRTKSKLSFSDVESEAEEEQESSIFKTVTQKTGQNDTNNNLSENIEKASFDALPDDNKVNPQRYMDDVDNRGFNVDSNGFDVRKAYGDYMIGNQKIEFKGGKVIVGEEKYPATEGLLELLFKKNVNDKLVTANDAQYYQKIALDSNLVRKNFKPNNSFKKPSYHPKFDTYLRQLNPSNNLENMNKSGKGLPKFMIAKRRERSLDYMYWDDPNELVDRLRVLVAERSAGNNNHNNEIIAIIEELREAKIIY